MSTPASVNGPCTSPVQSLIQRIYREAMPADSGQVATYIPELGRANPDRFGICVVTAAGHLYEVGDTREAFTIQSISKPFVYGLALEDNGTADVLAKVGVEPTGDAFNSISLEPGRGGPRNPMINAGAIATAGLVAGINPAHRQRRVLEALSLYAGRELALDEQVYRSESETGHRNRAIGHMLRNFDILERDPMETVELYFKQCSIAVDCRDLAAMAATLANHGVNPLTQRRALRGEYVESVLSVMGTCGMYDWAGEWLYRVGLPAKSGVAGGVLAVLPGQIGIGVYSPRLDSHGNSVRGVKVCELLSRYFNLHLFNPQMSAGSALRLQTSAAELNSRRVRSPAESAVLRRRGGEVRLFQLQGELDFTHTEVVVSAAVEASAGLSHLILDLRRVLLVNESSAHLLHDLVVELHRRGQEVVFAHAGSHPALRRVLKARMGDRYASLFRTFAEADSALEWCENRLLASEEAPAVHATAAAGDNELLNGLSPAQLAEVEAHLVRRCYDEGEVLIAAGAPADELFLLLRGAVSVYAPQAGPPRRLASFFAGMAFGELALLDRAPRSATIKADMPVEVATLSLAAFDALGSNDPAIKIRLLENLAIGLCQKLRKSNRELGVLE